METSLWDADNLCRTCAKVINLPMNADIDESIHIFDTAGLARKLSSCVAIEISLSDPFSKFLCTCCFQKVNDFFQFQQICKESLSRFEELHRLKDFREFEDEIPFPALNEQTCNAVLADTDISEENKPEYKPMPKKEASKKRTAKKIAKKREVRKKLEQNSDVQTNAYTSDRDDDDTNNFTINTKNNAHQIDFYADIKETRAKNHNSTQPTSKANTELKKTGAYECNICPSSFNAKHRLIAHKREHDGLAPYPCTREGCNKSFNRWNCLSRHISQHEGRSLEYICDQNGCNKVYKHKPTLVMHQRRCHNLGPKLKSHICEICGKVFTTTTILNDHRYTHKDESERPYACDQPNCMRRFATKEKLRVHKMRHAGIKNYVCPHCGMRKTTMKELKVHINYHTLERTWPCRFCTHVCNSAGNLKTHVRTVHERAKDYACRHCDRSFAKPDTRKYHEMTHTGEKPNQCPECGKRFTQPAALRTHSKIHQRQRARLGAVKNKAIDQITADHTEPKNIVENLNMSTEIKIESAQTEKVSNV